MACNFSIPITGSGAELISKARTAIGDAGGNFNGDDNSGSFDISTLVGDVRGSYYVVNNILEITISEKPMFLPCDMIESQLKEYLNK